MVEGAGNTFQAYEGATLSGALDGLIVGDPQYFPEIFVLDPGQNEINGFLGRANGDPPVPEASTWVMMTVGFGALALAAGRARRKALLAAKAL